MSEFLATPIARIVLSITAVLVAAAVGYYAVRKVREGMESGEPSANDWLTEFRRLHRTGKLSEFEFRRVKKTLGDKLQEEVRDSSSDG